MGSLYIEYDIPLSILTDVKVIDIIAYVPYMNDIKIIKSTISQGNKRLNHYFRHLRINIIKFTHCLNNVIKITNNSHLYMDVSKPIYIKNSFPKRSLSKKIVMNHLNGMISEDSIYPSKESIISNLRALNKLELRKTNNGSQCSFEVLQKCYERNYVIDKIINGKLLQNI